MKKLLLLLVASPIAVFGYNELRLSTIHTIVINPTSDISGLPYDTLTKNDAEKILGQPVKLTEEKKETRDGVIRESLIYTGLANDSKTNQTVNLNYLLEKYTDVGSAKNAYTTILKSNTGIPGQTQLTGIGDEAWFHSDYENFNIIIVRKKEKMLRIKINKLTKKFSMQELQNITRRIVLTLEG